MMTSHFDYSHRDWQVAAETLGEQVRVCMTMLRELPDGPAEHLYYRAEANKHLEWHCVKLAIEAAHAANCMLEEMEKEARYLSREQRDVNDALAEGISER